MAINEYKSETGETLYRVYINIRNKSIPTIRVQRKVSGMKTLEEARRLETGLVRECERELLGKEQKGSSWGRIVEEYERHLHSPFAPGISQHTKLDYVAAIRKHTTQWWERPASEITKSDARELFGSLIASGLSCGHAKRIKCIIGQIYEYGLDKGFIRGLSEPPTVGLKIKEDSEKKPEILTIDEIRRLLEAAKILKHKWYPVWALALLTGMRSGELYALEWDDIDFASESINVNKSYNGRLKVIKSTKAGYWRTVPISSELRRLLFEVKADAENRTHVLPRFYSWTKGMQARELRKFCIGLGLPSTRFHALRACFATQLIRNGIAPIQIQKICGWRDLKTMQRYIRLAGIEVKGATELLKVLPEHEFAEKVVNLFSK